MLNQKLTGQQAADKTYIEDVFSTYLYTGNGSTQTINNGIDLAGKGGMVWLKRRNYTTTENHNTIYDTNSGTGKYLYTDTTAAQDTYNPSTYDITSFNSNGFTLGQDWNTINTSGSTFASWTFRKAPKFFDVVTWTGNNVNNRQIAHSLGVSPGLIVMKCTSDSTYGWPVYHRSATASLKFNESSAQTSLWGIQSANATTFTISSDVWVNAQDKQYVAYLFAHDTSTDGLIQCGSFTAGASGFSEVNLGWEPQYILFKRADTSQNWYVWDTMRGMTLTSGVSLQPNLSDPESNYSSSSYVYPTAKGFAGSGDFFGNGANVIYMAIRRGPMRTPTDGTKVFKPYSTDSVSNSGSSISSLFNAGFVVDALLQKSKAGTDGWYMGSRLTATKYMKTETTAAEASSSVLVWDSNVGAAQYAGPSYGQYCFRRAPGFFDVVCYTGKGGGSQMQPHNLGVKPDIVIIKRRDSSGDWWVWYNGIPAATALFLEDSSAQTTATMPGSTNYTATTFGVATGNETDSNGATYVAYLFSSCPGVSKVFSFTGNGSSQTINCGFTNGARLVLIKRTDSTGDWYVWDTARGIVAGVDPHLSLNSTAAEVTTNDTINPESTGFIVNQVSATNVNVNGASYIGLAIA